MLLRALEPSDLAFLYLMENDRSLWPVTATSEPLSRHLLEDFISSSTGNIYADGQLRLIAENDEGERVAIVDLTDFSPQNLRAEVGIVVAPAYRRKGYGREALLRLEEYAQSVLHLHQLYALVPEDNAASLGLFRQVGYKAEATLRDWLYNGQKYCNVSLMQKFF